MQNQDLVTSIRQKIDIVDFIGSYVPLVQKGKNYFGVCPFHNDTNPSMSVSRDKQIYKCFSCGASGNVFTFLMDYEHIEFKEALQILAEQAGIKLENTTNAKSNEKYNKYYEIYDLANKFYMNNLNTQDGIKAKDYLKQRGFNDEVIKEFEIGLSTSNLSSLTNLLTKKNYDMYTLDKIGLCSGNHDIFINRIMIPLYDISGRVVGFSGRIYDRKSDSKYVNTKETEIFKKGMCLYNYHRAKEYTKKDKSVILMEGYMDVFRASSIGYKNVIAIMGTSLTEDQASLVKKLSPNVYLCLDGDDPGQKATITVGEQLTKAGLNVKVIPLSNKDDPDTYILNNGKDKFDSLFSSSISYNEFKLNYLKKGVNFKDDVSLSKYIDKVIYEASEITDEIRREIIIKSLANETNIGYNTLDKRLNEYLKKKEVNSKPIKIINTCQVQVNGYTKALYCFIYGMMVSDKARKLYHDKKVWILDSIPRYLANEIEYYYYKYGSINEADFFTYLKDKENILEFYNKVIAFIDSDNFNDSMIDELALTITEYNKKQEIKRLNELLKREVDEEEKSKIVEKIRLLRVGE